MDIRIFQVEHIHRQFGFPLVDQFPACPFLTLPKQPRKFKLLVLLMQEILKNWQFDAPPETLVLVEEAVINGNKPITCAVYLGDKTGWYFGYSDAINLDGAVFVRLMDVIAIDFSLNKVSRMPANWIARKSRGAWHFLPHAENLK